ncbi:MAG: hypothetical protein RLZZ21_766 [Planctomycetota bacterium]
MLQRLLIVTCASLFAGGLPALAVAMTATAAAVDDELAREPSWPAPSRAELRDRTTAWLATRGHDAAAAIEVWDDGAEPLDAVVAVIRRADPRAAAVDTATSDPVAAWLDGSDVDSFERDSLRLWLARELVRRDRFDEALPLLAGLDLATSVDPATLLFHRAVCQHWLLDAEAAVDSLDRLLERAGEIPVRYERVARLLRADIAGLEDGSLDHIARRMRDITRRLDLGRAGPRTRQVQESVVTSLDRLIKDLEDQQQQGASGSAGAGGGAAGGQGGAATPMDDSRLAGGQGKGEVQARDVGSGDGWGNLPPHAREAALQQIGREFPPHYREAIELYFKRLATGSEER